MFVKARFEYMDDDGIEKGCDTASFNDEGEFFAYMEKEYPNAERVPEGENWYWDENEMCSIIYYLYED